MEGSNRAPLSVNLRCVDFDLGRSAGWCGPRVRGGAGRRRGRGSGGARSAAGRVGAGAAAGGKRTTKVIVGFRIRGLDAQGFPCCLLCGGSLQRLFVPQCPGKQIPGIGIVRIRIDSSAELPRRARIVVLVSVDRSQRHVGLGQSRVDGQGSPQIKM
jgi:hypothetical protein